MASQPPTPMTPSTPRSPLSRLGSFSFGKSRLEAADQAELEIMTENLRSSPSLLTSPTKKAFSELHPDDFHLQDGEARSYLDPACLKEPAVKEVLDSLLSWLNQFLSESRVRLTSLEDDLKDGMVLKLVLEKLTGQEVDLPCGDFVQSRERQATNLEFVLQNIRDTTKASLPWKAESILSGDLFAVVSILVIMVRHFQEEPGNPAASLPDLPKAVKVTLLKLVMRSGTLQYEKQAVNLMGRDEPGKRDGFDTLIDHAPEKLHFVKQSLVKFANVHLSSLGWPVTSLETDFSDGVRLILLTGCLEGYFVPLHLYKLKPTSTEEKMENMNFAFRLIEEAGLPRPRNRPSEIVHNDLKATLRLVYSLFIKYKVT